MSHDSHVIIIWLCSYGFDRYELSCLSTEKGGDTPISLSESEDVVMETSQPQSKVTMLACREGSSQSLGDENSDASMEGYSSDEDIQDNEDSQLCESSIDTTPLLQAKVRFRSLILLF